MIGAFVDYDISDIDTSLSISIPPLAGANARADFNIENQLSIGGRLGYLVSPTTLFFTTFDYAHVETSDVKASLIRISAASAARLRASETSMAISSAAVSKH